ncbi:MAG TPA: DUF1287 domain-containing protein [Kofleriaceae bacterium]
MALCLAISTGCTGRSQADTGHPPPAAAPARPLSPPPPPPIPAETSLGLADHGIWSDLDDRIQLALPDGLTAARVTARIDPTHAVLVLSIDGAPRKAYPLGGPAALAVGEATLQLRPGDRAELAPLLTAQNTAPGGPKAWHADRDGDGIPDALDVLIGAKKTVVNADAYTVGAKEYISMPYPMGDVPRTIGVCTDVVIRAVRNAGIDLQQELHDDIRRARRAYPMVKGTGDPNIDQRRVGTLLPYFQRHWEAHSVVLDDPADPWRPGDVIFMDTFPGRPGPDHIGVLSDRVDAQGLFLVVNNWTDGMVTSEMDLLTFVPVLYRFRLPD